jgi:membrane protein
VKVGFRDMGSLLKETFSEWQQDNALRLGAALAYYTVFSLPPLLFIIVAIAGLVYGERAAQGELVGQLQGTVGRDAAGLMQTMIEEAGRGGRGIVATVVGVVVLLIGATTVFGELQASLNQIWGLRLKPGGSVRSMLRTRLLSFAMILTIGFLLLVSLVLSAALAALGELIQGLWPGPPLVTYLLHGAEILLSFGIVTLLFGAIYKVLPDGRITWRDVILGAVAPPLLFTIGKFLIGLYLGRSAVGSPYGAAGALIVLLLWIYYSAQILFFGAEFTEVYARRHGSGIRPDDNAEYIGKVRAGREAGKAKPSEKKAEAAGEDRAA